jgi:sterol desaturase/sphingolipid hydroxylase (fatty acid hydroxylase superfamily)
MRQYDPPKDPPMSDMLLNAEAAIRLAAFLGILIGMMLWELSAPRRRQDIPRVIRWTNNLGLVVLDTVILRLTFSILAVGLAVIGAEKGWGLFNNMDAPLWVAIVVSVLVLDLAIYLQHVLFHAVPGLWRLHRMHHADLEFDATTGLRFHPVEIVMSMGIKLAVVAALGPPAVAVLIFEVLLNGTALFNHGNVNLPPAVDRWLRLIVGASFAVLVAEEMFASGCHLLISVTSSGQITPQGAPPYFILIDRAWRDEGTSYHYLPHLPPGDWSAAPEHLLSRLKGMSDDGPRVFTGPTWTTDAPFRETETAIAAAKARGILAVEMEAAGLYAFATARRRNVICLAHVTNQMGTVEGDFEKGEANGSDEALRVVARFAARLR